MTITPSAVLGTIDNVGGKLVPASPDFGEIQQRGRPTLLGKIPPVDTENYQIALVPLQSVRGWNRNGRRGGESDELLLLPLTWKELITRLFKEIGGRHSGRANEIAHFGQVRIDLLSMEVARANRIVKLTAMEFKVLRFFLFNQHRVISREELLNEVWGYDNYPCTRTVDNHVLKLRQKLEPDPAHPIHFRTAHGMGYGFVP
jgi:DNA-binding winged helix-turn-helix (wHTH) protein